MTRQFLLGIFMLLSIAMYGQKGYEVGGWMGASQYYGELNSNVNFVRPGISFGAIGMYNFDERLSARVSLNYGRLRGTDTNASNDYEKNRNLSFYSNVYDLNVGVEFNFMKYIHGSEYDNMTPYLTLGVSFLKYNPKVKTDSTTYTLREWGTEGQLPDQQYNVFTWAPTVGVGFKYDITRDISVGVEASMRFTRSDYIDDVSKAYPEYETIRQVYGDEAIALSNRTLNNIAGATGQQRGNPDNKDKYVFVGIRVMKYFGRLDCPPISRSR